VYILCIKIPPPKKRKELQIISFRGKNIKKVEHRKREVGLLQVIIKNSKTFVKEQNRQKVLRDIQ
jgi:hypothetical protein